MINLCFSDLKVKYNKTDYIAYFPNGSEIHFVGLDDGSRSEKLLGLEFSSLYFNEASQISYSSIQLVISRLAQKNGLKKKVYFDFNPSTKSHWSYYLFVKKLDPIDNIPLNEPENYCSLKMNPTDNLENIDKDYIKMLENMPERERTRFLLGEFNDESNGQVYFSFRREEHVKPIERKPGTIWIGQDYNIHPNTAVIFQYYDNTFYVFDEVFLENADTFRVADELKRKGYAGARVIPDSTGRNRKTSGQSDFDIMKQAGFTIESTYNPFVGDRINNTNRLLASGRVVIDPKCKKLINDLEKVVWKDNKPDQSGENKMLTHISDALGYGLWKLEPFSKPDLKVTMGER